MKDKKEHYLLYLKSNFEAHLTQIRKGLWNTEIGDLLPLVIANMLQAKLVILKSDKRVVDINRDIADCLDPLYTFMSYQKVTLPHLSIKETEHYDAAIPKHLPL